jgi:hypothetical protein
LQVKFDIDQVDKGKRIQSWNGHLPIVVGGEKKRGFLSHMLAQWCYRFLRPWFTTVKRLALET